MQQNTFFEEVKDLTGKLEGCCTVLEASHEDIKSYNESKASIVRFLQEEGETWEEAIARSSRPSSRSKRRRSSSEGSHPQKQTTAGDAIIAAGYPLQIQRVVSPDGYVMYMERIPRPGNMDHECMILRTSGSFTASSCLMAGCLKCIQG